MAKYNIFKNEDKEKAGLPCLSFTIDGYETMMWFSPCKVNGLNENYYVERCINRLKQGRSEAFGGPGVVQNEKLLASGRKVRARTFESSPRRWKYELDGKACEEHYPTESLAKEACAVKEFLTRGKLGRLKEIEESFKTKHGKECKAYVKNNKITIDAADDKYFAAFEATGNIVFIKTEE